MRISSDLPACVAFLAILLASCGDEPETRIVTTAPDVASAPAPPPAAPLLPLAIALEGDVTRRSDTEYVATGPEIRCVAVLIEKDTPVMVTSEVRWVVEPGNAGVFSAGAQGVFFLPDAEGAATIRAVYPAEGEVTARSPGLVLLSM